MFRRFLNSVYNTHTVFWICASSVSGDWAGRGAKTRKTVIARALPRKRENSKTAVEHENKKTAKIRKLQEGTRTRKRENSKTARGNENPEIRKSESPKIEKPAGRKEKPENAEKKRNKFFFPLSISSCRAEREDPPAWHQVKYISSCVRILQRRIKLNRT